MFKLTAKTIAPFLNRNCSHFGGIYAFDFFIALPDIAQAVFEIVTLHIHHHNVRQPQGLIGKAGRQGLFFQHAPGD